MRQENIPALLSQTAASVNSSPIPAQNLLYVSAQIVAAGGGAGTLIIQASDDDPTSSTMPPTHWNVIPSATITVTGNGSFLTPRIDLCYQWIRLSYTNTGTGTISANVKAIGE